MMKTSALLFLTVSAILLPMTTVVSARSAGNIISSDLPEGQSAESSNPRDEQLESFLEAYKPAAIQARAAFTSPWMIQSNDNSFHAPRGSKRSWVQADRRAFRMTGK